MKNYLIILFITITSISFAQLDTHEGRVAVKMVNAYLNSVDANTRVLVWNPISLELEYILVSDLPSSGAVTTPTLQQVTDEQNGNITTNPLFANSFGFLDNYTSQYFSWNASIGEVFLRDNQVNNTFSFTTQAGGGGSFIKGFSTNGSNYISLGFDTSGLTSNYTINMPRENGIVLLDAPSDGTIYARQNGNWITSPSGGGSVNSVNGEVGTVVLDTGDISTVTDNNYVTDAEKAAINTIGNKLDSVLGGSGITIDNTDASNPIINASITSLDVSDNTNTVSNTDTLQLSSKFSVSGTAGTANIDVIGNNFQESTDIDNSTTNGIKVQGIDFNYNGFNLNIGENVNSNNTSTFGTNLGNDAGKDSSGSNNTNLGLASGSGQAANNSVNIGNSAGLNNTNDYSVNIGDNATTNKSNQVAFGGDNNRKLRLNIPAAVTEIDVRPVNGTMALTSDIPSNNLEAVYVASSTYTFLESDVAEFKIYYVRPTENCTMTIPTMSLPNDTFLKVINETNFQVTIIPDTGVTSLQYVLSKKGDSVTLYNDENDDNWDHTITEFVASIYTPPPNPNSNIVLNTTFDDATNLSFDSNRWAVANGTLNFNDTANSDVVFTLSEDLIVSTVYTVSFEVITGNARMDIDGNGLVFYTAGTHTVSYTHSGVDESVFTITGDNAAGGSAFELDNFTIIED